MRYRRPSSFGTNIQPAVEAELALARRSERTAAALSFVHLERAHVLGQSSTRQHVRVHLEMLRWARRHHARREIAGQAMRLVGAATKTVIGLVPTGNTGGTNVSPFKKLPVPADLASIIAEARR